MQLDWNIIARGLLPNPKFPLQNQKEGTLFTQLVFGEAQNQPLEGMKAVANVVINRWEKRAIGSIRDIILAKDQFTCFSPNDVNRRKLLEISIDEFPVWVKCAEASFSVYLRLEKDNTGGSTIYLTSRCYNHNRPKWDWSKLLRTTQIGDHIFFKEV